jgi:hypothetical protein
MNMLFKLLSLFIFISMIFAQRIEDQVVLNYLSLINKEKINEKAV